MSCSNMIIWTMTLLLTSVHAHLQDDFYTKVDLCEADVSLGSWKTFLMLECLRLCENKPQCKAFTRDGTNCTLYSQPVNSQCQGTRFMGYFIVKRDDVCQNGGFLESGACVCVHGFVGADCRTRMSSCSEGLSSGYYDGYDGVLPVHPTTSDSPFFVRCHMINNGRLFVQFRDNAGLDLYKNWAAMSDGFGSLTGDHWLGNQYLYTLLSARDMDLTFSFTIYNGTSFTRTYNNFKIKSKDNDFEMESFSATSGNLGGDCLAGLVGQAFSAVGHDRDAVSWWSCAFEHRGSWWFKSCDVPAYSVYGNPALCNPNGILTPTEDGMRQNSQTEVFWLDFPYSVSKTHIWLTDSGPST